MDDGFKREYLCEWGGGEYYEARKLWVKYSYECERWDNFICTGAILEQNGERTAVPITTYERRCVYKYAQIKMYEISQEAIRKGIPRKTFDEAHREVSRMSHKGIEELYFHYYGENGLSLLWNSREEE